ncbi:MAG: hypothetical protein GY953_10830, partial [bacterium]|nr:hypothetical protein [bacterium]
MRRFRLSAEWSARRWRPWFGLVAFLCVFAGAANGQGLADLIISTGSPSVSPSTVLPGGSVQLSAWTVSNIGNEDTGSFSNGFYLSTDFFITATDTFLGGNSNSNLNPEEFFAWGGPTLTIPAGTAPGAYYIGILVDRTNAVPEGKEGNNFVSTTLTVASPAPVITSLVPTQIPAGSSGFTLGVNGSGFVPDVSTGSGSQVQWRRPGTQTFITLPTNQAGVPTRLEATVSAALVQAPGVAEVRVRNVSAEASSNRVQFPIVESPPVITTTSPLPPGAVEALYSLTFAAEGGVAPYAWDSSGRLPPGLTFSNGQLTGRPTEAGTFTFLVMVFDQLQNEDERNFSITISPALEITTPTPLPSATVDQQYSVTLMSTGGLPPFSWILSRGSLPPGLILQTTGELGGVPSTAGTYMFTAGVADATGRIVTREYTLTVSPGGPIITTQSPLPDGTVGTPYSQSLAATDGTPAYQWARIEGALPPGLSLGLNGAIQGTPTATGQFSFQVRATDSEGLADEAVFNITINAPALRITTASPLPEGTEATAYSQSLAAAGGVPPYTWRLVSGSLPPGLALSSAGAITGTPSQAGAFGFRVRVMDSEESTTEKAFALTINEMPADPLVISTTSPLPPGIHGIQYNQTLMATGGVPPYSWTVVQGGVPTGLTLASSGQLSGTPTAAGRFGFTAEVMDTRETINRRHYTLVINPPAVPAITISGLPDQADPAQQETSDVALAEGFPLPLTGRVNMTF